jgi:hypothetical protein
MAELKEWSSEVMVTSEEHYAGLTAGMTSEEAAHAANKLIVLSTFERDIISEDDNGNVVVYYCWYYYYYYYCYCYCNLIGGGDNHGPDLQLEVRARAAARSYRERSQNLHPGESSHFVS